MGIGGPALARAFLIVRHAMVIACSVIAVASSSVASSAVAANGPTARAEKPTKCVQIYYDAAPQAPTKFYFGRVHALLLQNLLGHFPHIQQYVIPIEKYERDQIERCEANIYLGTYYDNPVPPAFLEDFVTATRTVVWAGYNVWRLPAPALEEIWNAKFSGITKLDETHRDEKGRPTFFRFVDYLGQTFAKYGEFDRDDPKIFRAAYELVQLDRFDPGGPDFGLAWAHHPALPNQRVPYVLRNDNHWFIADSPFSFATEEDRYLIFADLLFDILHEKPRRRSGPKPAFFRVEDVHPRMEPWQIFGITDFLYREKVPFGMSLIPIWSDPLLVVNPNPKYKFVPCTKSPRFIELLKYVSERGATFVYHGITHQFGSQPNPFTAASGDDFEFWDRVHNRPVAIDSPKFVVERIEDGLSLLKQCGVEPVAWLTPHYQASPLDYVLFAQLFSWNIGRVIYFPFTAIHPPALPEKLAIPTSGPDANGRRLPYLAKQSVSFPPALLPAGQFYPYEIYGDVYGQRIIPENTANAQPFLNEQVLKTVTIDDMIRTLRRNAVLRDSWASFFIHPSSLEPTQVEGLGKFPGDTRELARLVRETRAAGYEFIDLKTWAIAHRAPIRPEPIEVPAN